MRHWLAVCVVQHPGSSDIGLARISCRGLQLLFLVSFPVFGSLHLDHVARHKQATQAEESGEKDEVGEAAITFELLPVLV